jgi:hypothetical protein
MLSIYALADRLNISADDALALRRASMTLSAWAVAECGNSNERASWAIERDETTGKPFRCIYPHAGKPSRYPVPDRESGALRRIAAICKAAGIHWHHQTDPRGLALYLSKEPLEESNYTQGLACGKHNSTR